jgi:hypothetical protein
MIRALLVLAVAVLAGCASSNDAGIANYKLIPYFDAAAGKYVCCEVDVVNGKNIASVNVHITKSSEDALSIDLNEQGVNGSTGQGIASATATSVATAVSTAAASAVQIIHPVSLP